MSNLEAFENRLREAYKRKFEDERRLQEASKEPMFAGNEPARGGAVQQEPLEPAGPSLLGPNGMSRMVQVGGFPEDAPLDGAPPEDLPPAGPIDAPMIPARQLNDNQILELAQQGLPIDWRALGIEDGMIENLPTDEEVEAEIQRVLTRRPVQWEKIGNTAVNEAAAHVAQWIRGALWTATKPGGAFQDPFTGIDPGETPQMDEAFRAEIEPLINEFINVLQSDAFEQRQDMTLGERTTTSIVKMAALLPFYRQFMKVAARTTPIAVNGQFQSKLYQKVADQLVNAGVDARTATGILKVLSRWLEEPVREGIGFGLADVFATLQSDSDIQQVAHEFVNGLKFGTAMGAGGQLAKALNLPYIVAPIPGATVAAGFTATEEQASYEDVIESFMVMYGLGFLHTPKQLAKFERYAQEYSKALDRAVETKYALRDVDLKAYEAALEVGDAERAKKEEKKPQPKAAAKPKAEKKAEAPVDEEAVGEAVPEEERVRVTKRKVTPEEQARAGKTLSDAEVKKIEQQLKKEGKLKPEIETPSIDAKKDETISKVKSEPAKEPEPDVDVEGEAVPPEDRVVVKKREAGLPKPKARESVKAEPKPASEKVVDKKGREKRGTTAAIEELKAKRDAIREQIGKQKKGATQKQLAAMQEISAQIAEARHGARPEPRKRPPKPQKPSEEKTPFKVTKTKVEPKKPAEAPVEKRAEHLPATLREKVLFPEKGTRNQRKLERYEELDAIYRSLRTNRERERFLREALKETEKGKPILNIDTRHLNRWRKAVGASGKKVAPMESPKTVPTQQFLEQYVPGYEKMTEGGIEEALGRILPRLGFKPYVGGDASRNAGKHPYSRKYGLMKYFEPPQRLDVTPEAVAKKDVVGVAGKNADFYTQTADILSKRVIPIDAIKQAYKKAGLEPPATMEAIAQDVANKIHELDPEREGVFVKALDKSFTAEGIVTEAAPLQAEGEVDVDLIRAMDEADEILNEEAMTEVSSVKKKLPSKPKKAEVIKQEKIEAGSSEEEALFKMADEYIDDIDYDPDVYEEKFIDYINPTKTQAGFRVGVLVSHRAGLLNDAKLDTLENMMGPGYVPEPSPTEGGAKILAHGINTALAKNGGVSLVGHTIRTARDVPALGRIIKSTTETGRIILTDDRGTVIEAPTVTARNVNSTPLFPEEAGTVTVYKSALGGKTRYIPILKTWDGGGMAIKGKDNMPIMFDTEAKAWNYIEKGKNVYAPELVKSHALWLANLVDRYGGRVKSLWLQHNHPSGNPAPSPTDINTLYWLVRTLIDVGRMDVAKKIRAKVVTDHETYSVFTPQQAAKHRRVTELVLNDNEIPENRKAEAIEVYNRRYIKKAPRFTYKNEKDRLFIPEKPGEALYHNIHKDNDVWALGAMANVERPDSAVAFFQTSRSGMVTSVHEIPYEIASNAKKLEEYLKKYMPEAAASTVSMYTGKEGTFGEDHMELYEKGVVRHFVTEKMNFIDFKYGEGITQPVGVPASEPEAYSTLEKLNEKGQFSRFYQFDRAGQRHRRGPTIRLFEDDLPEEAVGPYYFNGRLTPVEEVDWSAAKDVSQKAPSLADFAVQVRDIVPVFFGKQSKKYPFRYRRKQKIASIRSPIDFENLQKMQGLAVYHNLFIRNTKAGEMVTGLSRAIPPEMKALAVTGRPKYLTENMSGFSEWFHRYIVDPAEAESISPKFTRNFEALLSKPENQPVAEYVREARSMWQHHRSPEPVRWVGKWVRTRADVKEAADKRGAPKTTSKFMRSVKDASWPFWERTQNAIKDGLQINPSEHPGMLAALARGSNQRAEHFLLHGTYSYAPDVKGGTVVTGPSLMEIYEPIDRAGLMDIFDNYLFAKRVANDDRLIAPYQRADSGVNAKIYFETAVKLLEEKFPAFTEAREQLDGYVHELMNYIKDAGVVNESLQKTIEDANRFWIPLYTIRQEEMMFRDPVKRQSAQFNPLKRVTGKEAEVFSPSESLIYNTYTMIAAADRNRARVAAYRLWETGVPEYSQLFRVVDLPKKQVRISPEEMKQLLKDAGVGEELVADMSEEEFAVWRPVYRLRDNERIVRVDGEDKVLQFSDTEMMAAFDGMDPWEISGWLKPLRWITRRHREFATSFSYKFGVRNLPRDTLMAAIQSKFNFIPVVDTIIGSKSVLAKDENFKQMMKSGGGMSGLLDVADIYHERAIRKIMNAADPAAYRAFRGFMKNPLSPIAWFGQTGEMAPRARELQKAMKAFDKAFNTEGGMEAYLKEMKIGAMNLRKLAKVYGWDTSRFNHLDALLFGGYSAKEVTLDYSRIGSGRVRTANSLISFFNANLEAVDKMRRTFKERPVLTTARVLGTISALSLWEWWHYKDDPNWNGMPRWRKIIAWNTPIYNDKTGEHLMTIMWPKPWTLGIAGGSMLSETLDYIYRDSKGEHVDGTAIVETLKQVGLSLYPGVTPTALVPLIEGYNNWNYFYQRPLVPQDKIDLEEWRQFQPWNSKTTKLLGKYMYKVPLIKKFSSPAKIENAIRGYLSGLGGLTLKGTDAVLNWLDVGEMKVPPSPQLSEYPLLDAFLARWPEPRSRAMEEFYDQFNRLQEKRDTHFDVIGLRGNLDKLDPLFGIDGNHWTVAEALMMDKLTATHKQLSALGEVVKGIWADDNLSGDEKRQLLDGTYWFMNNIARVGLGQSEAVMQQWANPTVMNQIFNRALTLGSDIKIDFSAYDK